MKLFIILTFSLIFSHSFIFSQKSPIIVGKNYYGNTINEREICDLVAFSSRPEVSMAIENIVKRSGLKQNFYVMECPNTDNCFAATRNGERLIVYDPKFIQRISSTTKTDWAALSILAHEIGHHLQGHTIKAGGSEHQKELEADEFSGFVMYQLGASLREAQSAISTLTTEYATSTHPPRTIRLKSIERGYKNAQELYPQIKRKGEVMIEAPSEEIMIIETEIVKNESTRKGCVSGTCFEGFGVAINSKSQEKYEGNWHIGKRHGSGKEFFKDGKLKYDGGFKEGKYHGKGYLILKNGEKYSGGFLNGKMHGEASVYTYKNGDRLVVNYINGKKEGKAKIIYYGGVEGTKYFKNDQEVKF